MRRVVLCCVLIVLMILMGFDTTQSKLESLFPVLPVKSRIFGGCVKEVFSGGIPRVLLADDFKSYEFLSQFFPVKSTSGKIITNHYYLYVSLGNRIEMIGNGQGEIFLDGSNPRLDIFDYDIKHDMGWLFDMPGNKIKFFRLSTMEEIGTIPSSAHLLTVDKRHRGHFHHLGMFINPINLDVVEISQFSSNRIEIWDLPSESLIIQDENIHYLGHSVHRHGKYIVSWKWIVNLETGECVDIDKHQIFPGWTRMYAYDDHVDMINGCRVTPCPEGCKPFISVIGYDGVLLDFITPKLPIITGGALIIYERFGSYLIVANDCFSRENGYGYRWEVQIINMNTGEVVFSRPIWRNEKRRADINFPDFYISENRLIWFDQNHVEVINPNSLETISNFEISPLTQILMATDGLKVLYPKETGFRCISVDNKFEVIPDSEIFINNIHEISPLESRLIEEIIPKNIQNFNPSFWHIIENHNPNKIWLTLDSGEDKNDHGMNEIVEFAPCPSFSIKRRTSGNTDGKISFEFEMTRSDGLSEPFDGVAYLVAWGEKKEYPSNEHSKILPSAPVFSGLGMGKIQIGELKFGDKNIVTFDLPLLSSVILLPDIESIVDKRESTLNKELKYFSLFVESNGLLDTENSVLSDIETRQFRFEGSPMSTEYQKSIVMTLWSVD